MTISLITVCFNSATVIRTAMESVLSQTWPEIEYLVIDGGSTDGTVEAVRDYEPKFQGRMRWVSEKDDGMYDALNKGIRMATGEVVGLLNADDVLAADDVIEQVASVFVISCKPLAHYASRITAYGSRFTELPDAIYGDVRFVKNCVNAKLPECLIEEGEEEIIFNHKDRKKHGEGLGQPKVFWESANDLAALRKARTVRYYSARHWHPWMLRWGFMPPHPSVYIRREWFERLGFYKTDYQIAADYELLIRYLWKPGLRAVYLPGCLVTMRMGGKSTKGWRSNLILNREIVRGNRDNGVYTNLAMLVPKYAFKVWEFIATT